MTEYGLALITPWMVGYQASQTEYGKVAKQCYLHGYVQCFTYTYKQSVIFLPKYALYLIHFKLTV